MTIDRRLQWVMANRGRPPRARTVGSAVAKMLGGLDDIHGEALVHLAARIGEVVDAAFREHCRVAVTPDGTLLVNVDAPALVYAMRSRWLGPLAGILSTGRRRVRNVRFEYGREGYPVGTATSPRIEATPNAAANQSWQRRP